MRHLLSVIFIAIAVSIIANDTLVIVRRDGRQMAIMTDSIDSIHVINHTDVADSLFRWTDTLEVHDTLVVYDTLEVHDTLEVRDTLVFYDTLTVRKDVYHSIMTTDNWYVNIENPIVAAYLNTVDYSGYENDYSFTCVTDYANTPVEYRSDEPRGAHIEWNTPGYQQQIIISLSKAFANPEDTIIVKDSVTSADLFNLLPATTYYYRVMAGESIVKQSRFTTTGQVRMMHLPSIHNVRDLGGWPTIDGQRMRYGRLYRGGEMNDYNNIALSSDSTHQISPSDRRYMHDKMNIRLDMDLRDNRDLNLNDSISFNDRNHTELGSDVEYVNEQVNHNIRYFYDYRYNIRFARAITKIIATLRDGGNVYFHCVWGADRTGTLAMLIEGLCGVDEADLNKDYELTAFYSTRDRRQDYWVANLKYIKALPGATLRDKFETYCTRIGVSKEDIDTLRQLMLE